MNGKYGLRISHLISHDAAFQAPSTVRANSQGSGETQKKALLQGRSFGTKLISQLAPAT